MAVPIMMYGSETWTLHSKDLSRIQAAKMKFLRMVNGCTRTDKLRNEYIREDLHMYIHFLLKYSAPRFSGETMYCEWQMA